MYILKPFEEQSPNGFIIFNFQEQIFWPSSLIFLKALSTARCIFVFLFFSVFKINLCDSASLRSKI